MLPITRRKAFEIPHGLAALAAAVCLALAFAADQSGDDERQMASQPTSVVVESDGKETSDASEKVASSNRDSRRQQADTLSLLPWLLRHGGSG